MIPLYFAYVPAFTCLLGAYLYIREMVRGTTRPNRVSWFFWGVAPLIGTYISYKSGVSLPILASTFFAGFITVPILIASFFVKGAYWKTTWFDIGCGILSAVSIIIWLSTKNGLVSLVFAILADIFAGIPTLIKSWRASETESAGPYAIGTFNQVLTFLMIRNFSFLNTAFPTYLILTNIAIMLGIYRKKLFS